MEDPDTFLTPALNETTREVEPQLLRLILVLVVESLYAAVAPSTTLAFVLKNEEKAQCALEYLFCKCKPPQP